jgi:hypothetical protein
MINLRNALMAEKRLPYDAEVEFLESTGTQWIDTGIISDGTGLTVEVTCSKTTSATQEMAIVGRSGNNGFDLYVLNSKFELWNSSNRVAKNPTTISAGEVYDVIGSTAGGAMNLSVNGVNSSRSGVTSFPNRNIVLFRHNSKYYWVGRLMFCKIWQNGVLVRDFIPVRKGTVGYLYDRVSGKLFGNAGTGDFVLGPDVVPVEYLQSSGTEYIDTGVSPFEGMGLHMQYKPMAQGAEQRLFGVRTNIVFNYGYYGATANFWDIGGRISMAQVPFDSVSVMTLNNGTIDFNNYQYSYTNVPTSADNCYLFAWNRNPLLFATARVYELKLWDSSASNPLRSFRPVRVGTDATSWEGAMMDVLTRRIYRNAGTGAFTYGNDLKYPIPAS